MTDGTSSGAKSATPQSGQFPWVANYPEGVVWDMPIQPEPLPVVLRDAAKTFPANPAISFMGKITTYKALQDIVDRVASGLQSIGVQKGTKVGLFLPNTPTFIIYYYAILKAGGTVVNFNPLYTHEELTFQVRDSHTEIMVTHDLAALFPKVETLIKSGTLARAIIVPFAAELPSPKRQLFLVFKRKDRADTARSPIKDKLVDGAMLAATTAPMRPVVIDPVEDVAVLPDRQGQGIGKAMMAFALERCREAGCYKMALSSNLKRGPAHAFYDALGFERHGYSFVIRP